jgi:hypothetical protein
VKRYKPFFKEKRMVEYKAWYNPSSNYFRQFSSNGIHNEIAEQELMMDEITAIRKGYFRIFVGKEINVDSYSVPTNREFKALQDIIEKNSYKKFNATRWSIVNQKGLVYFPNQSFLFADSIKDGRVLKFK